MDAGLNGPKMSITNNDASTTRQHSTVPLTLRSCLRLSVTDTNETSTSALMEAGTSYYWSNSSGHSHSSNQARIQLISELEGATWEHDAITLARALSAKQRKSNAPSFKLDDIDELGTHYNIDIDLFEEHITEAAAHLKPITIPKKEIKSQIYEDLADFLNSDRKSTRLNSSHSGESRMPSSA